MKVNLVFVKNLKGVCNLAVHPVVLYIAVEEVVSVILEGEDCLVNFVVDFLNLVENNYSKVIYLVSKRV